MSELWESIKNFFVSERIVDVIFRVLIAIAFLFITTKLVRVITKKIMASRGMMRLNKTVRAFLGHLIIILFYILVAVATVMILDWDLSVISAAIASAGLAVGLALQGGLSNIAGGVIVVAFKPFEVGDYIETNDVGGTVTDIGIFYTTLTTPDNKKVVIPNGTVTNSVVQNYSAFDTRRLDLDFPIAYSADIDLAKKVLYTCSKMDERILTDPAPKVVITAHNDSSITISLRVWVSKDDLWDVKFDMLEQVKRSFDQCGIEIPFPQLDVHIER